jgi:hypothetical protein
MNLGDATQVEETEFARHEEQVVSGQSENRWKNLDFSSNSGGAEQVIGISPAAGHLRNLTRSLWVVYEGITCH